MIYRKEIDGLRALAVISVIFYHSGFNFFSGGYVGVDIFFVISGYLITTILIEDIENHRFSLSNFYIKRVKRILPALYLVITVTAIGAIFILYPAELISFAKSLISVPVFLSNFFFWSERGYFNSDAFLKPLIHTWSLAVEEQFYIFFPIILFFLRKKIIFFYILLIVSFLFSFGLSYYLTLLHFETAFFLLFARAYEIILGSFAALYLKNYNISIKNIYADLFSTIGISFIVYSIISFDNKTVFPYINSFIPTFGSFLFIIFSQYSKLVKKIFSLKILVFIGLISYSLYLWHQPVFVFAKKLNFFDDYLLLILLLILIISYLTYRCFEKPLRKKIISGKKTFIYFLVSSLILMIIGFIIIFNNGFLNQYSIEDRKVLSQLESYKKYNQENFDNLKFKNFSSEAEYKVLLIGDSYAKDFLNIIIESEKFKNFSFSTRQINGECGNLYLKNYDVLKKFIPKNRLLRCQSMGRYEGEDFRKIIDMSDEIWLVSTWTDWVIPFLSESIANIRKDFQKPVRVFGIKHFGNIDPYRLLKIPSDQRASFSQALDSDLITRSKKLDLELIDYKNYYPLLEPLCGGDKFACKIFTPDNYLMSVDGGHLSKKGAIEASSRLRLILNEIVNSF